MGTSKFGPPPEYSVLIFAGYATITEANLTAQLSNLLPEDLPLSTPAIQASIPRGPSGSGLREILAWLKGPGQFKESDIDRPDDLIAHMRDLNTAEPKFLIVLWGEGDDPETEELVAAAHRFGVTVLDLTDGLEEIQLDDNQPDKTEPAKTEPAARRARRSRKEEAAEPAAEAEKPPWEPLDTSLARASMVMPRDEFTLAEMLAGIFEVAGAALRSYSVAAPAASQSAQRSAVSRSQATPESEPPADEPTAAATKPNWLLEPGRGIIKDDPATYPRNSPGKYKRLGRGRPRTEHKDWLKIYLNPRQEKELGIEQND